MPGRNPRRGVHAPHTRNQRIVTMNEIDALGNLHVGAISIVDYQLGDDRFREWLEQLVPDGLQVFCRVFHESGQLPDPVAFAQHTANLAEQYPFVHNWIPLNEVNLEYQYLVPQQFDSWANDFWWNFDWHRNQRSLNAKLYYPSLAQDMGSPWHHTEWYPQLLPSINLWLDKGDGFSWHSYWDANDLGRLIENEFPNELRERLPYALTLIHESGRKIDAPSGVHLSQYGLEINHRFGSARYGVQGTSIAKAVTHWLLSSADPLFEHQAWIGNDGSRRQILYEVAYFGA